MLSPFRVHDPAGAPHGEYPPYLTRASWPALGADLLVERVVGPFPFGGLVPSSAGWHDEPWAWTAAVVDHHGPSRRRRTGVSRHTGHSGARHARALKDFKIFDCYFL